MLTNTKKKIVTETLVNPKLDSWANWLRIVFIHNIKQHNVQLYSVHISYLTFFGGGIHLFLHHALSHTMSYLEDVEFF